jgi:L-iditol 2-dehydrogenase
MCKKANIYGHQKIGADGGMAQYMKYSVRDVVHKVSKKIPAKYAAMIEPLSCSVPMVVIFIFIIPDILQVLSKV